MDLIDERLDNGSISESDTKSYKVKSPSILTMGQNELIKEGDLFKTHEISCSPIPNLLGEQFKITEHLENDLIFQAIGAKAYYFEVDGEATIYIEELDGTVLDTINVDNTVRSFTAYKGAINTSDDIRLRFTGDYYYRVTNVALYPYKFQVDRIPDYRPWVKKVMPNDFKRVDQIVKEYPQSQYVKESDYKWEGRKDLYTSYDFNGTIRVVYRPVPTKITDLSQNLEIDDVTATTLLPYFLATHLMLEEKDDLAGYFNDRYEQLKYDFKKKPPATEEPIIDVYGGI
jgi:hypothetical protein